MLESVSIRNYKSIESTVLDLSCHRRRSVEGSDYLPFLEDGRRKVVPVLVIYGANSSGKSTFLSALKTFSDIVVTGYRGEYYRPNRLAGGDEDTSFSLSVLSGGVKWEYTLSYDGESIKEERLVKGEAVVYAGGRKIQPSLKEYDSPRRELENILFFDPFSYSVEDSFSTYLRLSGKSREECLDNVLSLVRKLDLTVDNIIDGEEWKTEHRNRESDEILFSLTEESEGTRRLISLISVMLASLSTGALLIVDEIDVSLHSMVLRSIVSLFADRRYNTRNAQLICSSHNTDLLDAPFLHSDEIALFEKTRKRGSTIERLSDKKCGRSPSSRREYYLKGGYSGIPFPYV